MRGAPRYIFIFVVAVIGIACLYLVFNRIIALPVKQRTNELLGFGTSIVTAISTIVGFVAGQAAGAEGKDKADEKAAQAGMRAEILAGQLPQERYGQLRQEFPQVFGVGTGDD